MCNTVHHGSHVDKRYAGNQVLYGTVNFEHSNYWFQKLGDLRDTLSQVLGLPVYFTRYSLGGVWEQSFSAVLKQYCSIEQYCGIIYFEVFGNSSEISVY
jgi:hypothetical protein